MTVRSSSSQDFLAWVDARIEEFDNPVRPRRNPADPDGAGDPAALDDHDRLDGADTAYVDDYDAPDDYERASEPPSAPPSSSPTALDRPYWHDSEEPYDPVTDSYFDDLRYNEPEEDPAGQPTTFGRSSQRRARPVPVRDRIVEDLPPLVTPAGYLRDRVGRWRYVHDGSYVPGARDITLRRLYRPQRCGCSDHVLFNAWDVADDEALAWVDDLAEPCPAVEATPSKWQVAVGLGDWRVRADVALGLDAPELTASRLLDSAAAARMARITPTTLAAYLSRGKFPDPVSRIGRSPVWSSPIVAAWRR